VSAVSFREDLSTCPSTGGIGAFGGTRGDYWDFGGFGDFGDFGGLGTTGDWGQLGRMVWEDLLMRRPKTSARVDWDGLKPQQANIPLSLHPS